MKMKSHFTSPQSAQGLEMMNVGRKDNRQFCVHKNYQQKPPNIPTLFTLQIDSYISNSIFVIKFSLLNIY